MKVKSEKGVSIVSLVITIIILLMITGMLIYNAPDSVKIQALTNLYNDIDLLNEKVSAYYEEYGAIPAKIEYTNISKLENTILSEKEKTSKFYIIDLQELEGITLNFGKEYEQVKNDESNANSYQDVYIINEVSHNIFYVNGITLKENETTKTYYTNYTTPDNTTIDLRYIDNILIPEGYTYVGKETYNNNESIVIKSDITNAQYIWNKINKIEKKPASVELSSNQTENELIRSANHYKGYFINKNNNSDILYLPTKEGEWSEEYTKELKYTDKNGDEAYIPKGYQISLSPLMNKIENGLVIKDINDIEYVWIEVPKTITENSEIDKEIEDALIKYVKEYRKENENDEYYNECGLTQTQYNQTKSTMLQSIKNKGGFWISRNAFTQVFTAEEAETIAKTAVTNEENTSSLLFGIQWDLVCKFIDNNNYLINLESFDVDSLEWTLENKTMESGNKYSYHIALY